MKSLLETMFGAIIGVMVIMMSINLTDAVVATSINGATDMAQDNSVRLATGEMQLHLRNASRVLASATVGNTIYSTGPTTLVVAAPAFNAGNSSYFITGQDDTIIFTYDAANQEIRETIVASGGTARPQRTLFTIGRSVTDITFTYNCRQAFTATVTGSSTTYTLATLPVAASVKAYVNGTLKATAVANSVVTLTDTVTANDLVQVFYIPQTFSASAPVTEVTFTIQQSSRGARAERTTTAQGSARLRNYRN